MGLDDPTVWILIALIVVFMFGASKIPQLARSLGQARREFDNASKGITSTNSSMESDPLILAAQKEGIDTTGKTREQIASDLAWKLSKK